MQRPLLSIWSLIQVLCLSTNALDLSLRSDGECTDVHIFLARGNNEPYPGRQGKLVAAICQGLKSCDYEDIQYFNPLPAPYCESVTEGAANGVKQITAYNKRCPDTKLVASGYSQGAHVLGDVLGGGGGVFFENCVQPESAGLSPKTAPGNKIAAALIFGDTRHTAGQPYNVLGGSGSNGLFPRSGQQLANLNAFSSVLHAYCATNDPICAGGDIVDEHLNYFDVYSEEAAAWVREMLNTKEETPTTSAPPPPLSKTTSIEKPKSTSSLKTSKAKTTTSDADEARSTTSHHSTTASTDSDSTHDGSIHTSHSIQTTLPETESMRRASTVSGSDMPTASKSQASGSSESDEPAMTTGDQAAESTESAAKPTNSDSAAQSLRSDLTTLALLAVGLLML